MHRKLTWLACTLALALIVAPALIAQTTWVVSDDDDDEGFGYALFGLDDSAFLGVTMEEETEHEEGGARINSVVEGSPAEDAGLQEGDIVIRFAKQTIRGPVGLTKKIRDREPGDQVQIVVLRDGRKHTLDIELGKRSAYSSEWSSVAPLVLGQLQNLKIPDFEFKMEELQGRLEELNFGQLEGLENLKGLADITNGFAFSCEGDDCNSSRFRFYSGRPLLGVQLTETTPELREHLGGSADAGVLVGKVIKGTAAADAGVEVGDLIVDVDGDPISSTNDLRRALAERDGEVFDIEVIRDRRSIRLQVTLEADDEERPTGPRAWNWPVPRPTAPAFVAPRVAPRIASRVIPQIAPRLVPQIRERLRLTPTVVEIKGAAPTLASVPVAEAVVVAPVRAVAPVVLPLRAPVVEIAPPIPAFPVLTKDDAI